MEIKAFDRIAKALAASSARRQAVRASLGGLFAALIAAPGQDVGAKKKGKGKKKKKKPAVVAPPLPPLPPPPPPPPRCLNLRETCDATARCCGNEVGVTVCEDHTNPSCTPSGRYCCGLEGVVCRQDPNHCDCCSGLFCVAAEPGKFRCNSEEP
jgi:hypothetical protein